MKALRLESFAADHSALPDPTAADTDARLATFEQGYAAGWDDATAARQDERALTDEQVARALMSVAYSAADARRHVLLGLRPLIEAMVTQLAPAIARDGLAALVAETLMPIARELAEGPVTLRLHPSARLPVEAHLSRLDGQDFALVEDASLGEGQVVLSQGPSGARIDLDAAIAEIRAAAHAFYTLLPPES